MSQPIDVEWVELRAKGDKEAAADIAAALKAIAKEARAAAKKIETDIKEAFAQGTDAAKVDIAQLSAKISRETAGQKRDVRGVGTALAADIAAGAAVAKRAVDDLADDATHDLNRIQRGARNAGKSIATDIGGSSAFKQLFENLAQVGGQLRAISALAPSPLITFLIIASPAIAALAGTLVDLLGVLLALPAAVAVLAATIAPLVLAFSGLGEAVTALASGDLEKIDAALKKLSPSARVFAKEINALRAPLRELKKDVQESFFAPLRGDLTTLVGNTLPTLRVGLTSVSAALGRMASRIFGLLGGQDVVRALGAVFESTARIIDRMSPSFTRLIGTIFAVIERGLPFVERMSAALGRAMDALSGFLSGTLKTGSFERFLEDSFTGFKDLWNLIKSLTGLLATLFGQAGDEGHSFLVTLTGMVDRLNAFFKTSTGQQAWQNFLNSVKLFNALLAGAIGLLIAFATIQVYVVKAVSAISKAVMIAGDAIGTFFVNAWHAAGDAINSVGDALQTAWDATSKFFTDLGRTIADFGAGALTFFKNLPGQIWSFISSLPGIVRNTFMLVVDTMLYQIGFAIGSVLRYFYDLPKNTYNAIVGLIGIVKTVFTTMQAVSIDLVRRGFDAIVFITTQLPGRLWSALVSIISRVRSIFMSTRDSAVSISRGMINSVVSFFWDMPGRVTSAMLSLRSRVLNVLNGIAQSSYNTGRNIVIGIVNGIRDLIGWAVDWAKYAAKRILQGAADAIHIGSPSRDARDEVGKPLMQGVGVGIQEETPNVVDTIQRAMSSTLDAAGAFGGSNTTTSASSSIIFGAGAVQVTFQGVVPTEQEARDVGTSVADGIAQALARRSIRTAVRTA